MAIAVDKMWGTGEFDGGVMMTGGEGDFSGEKIGVWCNDDCT